MPATRCFPRLHARIALRTSYDEMVAVRYGYWHDERCSCDRCIENFG